MNPMEEFKKNRGVNFKKEEKSILVALIAKHKNVVENKRTDSVTIRGKELAWKDITQEFNSNMIVTKRTTKQLKNCYDNFKRRAKRKCAQDKINVFKTEGGSPSVLDETEAQLLSIMNDPLHNDFDSDHLYTKAGFIPSTSADVGSTYQFDCQESPAPLEASSSPVGIIVDVHSVPVFAVEAKESSTIESVTSKPAPTPRSECSEKIKGRIKNLQSLNKIKKSEAAKARQQLFESKQQLLESRQQLIDLKMQKMIEKHKACMEAMALKKEALCLKIKCLKEKLNE